MMEKAAVFIDGGYLSRILRDYFKGQKIDYAKFSDKVCELTNVERLRTYYYNCKPKVRPNNKSDEKKDADMNKFLRKIKRLPRFEVALGKLQHIGGKFTQKMVDVKMSLDIADMSYEGQIHHAILVAGDSDFVPAIQRAKNSGAIVHVIYHPKSIHNHLLDEVDESIIINDDLIKDCKINK